jgi:hypothetical protein
LHQFFANGGATGLKVSFPRGKDGEAKTKEAQNKRNKARHRRTLTAFRHYIRSGRSRKKLEYLDPKKSRIIRLDEIVSGESHRLMKIQLTIGDRVRCIDANPSPAGKPAHSFGRTLVGKTATVVGFGAFGGITLRVDGWEHTIVVSRREIGKVA